MKVFVYFNLHKKVWSVKALEGPNKGKVIEHTTNINIANAKFKVSEAGRQRVLREKKKNVHAGVTGIQVRDFKNSSGVFEEVSYNPYKGPTFVKKDNNHPIMNASFVTLVNRKVYASIDAAE